MGVKYAVIGASAAGVSAVREILTVDSDADITIFSEEDRYPYYRPMLSEFIADKDVQSRSSFFLNKEEWYDNPAITWRPGVAINEINRSEKILNASDGKSYSYDRAVLAVGSRPFIPLSEKPDFKQVFSLRTYDDAVKISNKASESGSAVVIGGGLLGLEAAYSLSRLGLKVIILELAGRLMQAQLDEGGSDFLLDIVHESGVEVMLSDSIETVDRKDGTLMLNLNSGKKIETDMLVVSAGVRPDTELADMCGLEVNKGIVVDSFMATSDPDIFACGDPAEFQGNLTPLWMPAVKKGRIAGSNAAGEKIEYQDEIYPVALSTFGVKLFCAGNPSGHDGPENGNILNRKDSSYKSINFSDNNISGFVTIGDTADSQKLLKHLKSGSGYDDLKKEGLF